MLDKKKTRVHGCLKPVNTHGLDLVRHDGRFLAMGSTLELKRPRIGYLLSSIARITH